MLELVLFFVPWLILFGVFVYLVMSGVSILVAALIFVFPICLWTMYFIFAAKQAKLREKREISMQIVDSIKSNDGEPFTAETFERLEKYLKEQGIELNCDLSCCFK